MVKTSFGIVGRTEVILAVEKAQIGLEMRSQ